MIKTTSSRCRLPLLLCILVYSSLSIFCNYQEALAQNIFFPPLPNYSLVYKKQENKSSLEYPISDVEVQTIKGEKYFAQYSYAKDKGPNIKNPFQIMNVFAAKIEKKRGGAVVYKDSSFEVLKYDSKEWHNWIFIETFDSGKKYSVTIVRKRRKEDQITAETIFQDLMQSGKSTIYINFSTNVSMVPKSSYPLIKTIYTLMQKHDDLKISIEGHTDNVGNVKSNKTLSQARAKSVVQELIKLGISKDRLQAKGFGSQKPIVSNDTEKGRSANRRVELVRKN